MTDERCHRCLMNGIPMAFCYRKAGHKGRHWGITFFGRKVTWDDFQLDVKVGRMAL